MIFESLCVGDMETAKVAKRGGNLQKELNRKKEVNEIKSQFLQILLNHPTPFEHKKLYLFNLNACNLSRFCGR